MLERENAFYAAHKADLREKYLNKYLVITGGALFGVYDRFADAAKDAVGRLGSDEFMIHKPADDGKIIEIPTAQAMYPDTDEEPKAPLESFYTSGGDPVTFTYPY